MPNDSILERSRQWLSLNLAQQAVWLDAKLGGASVYQLGGWARIAAPVDEGAVRQSVSLIMARHDALRLRVDDELPRQWLDDSVEPPVSAADLGPDGFEAFLERAFQNPMPLGDRPLFAIDLLRAPDGATYILWRFHHLVADSASVAITLRHWFGAYQALQADGPAELSPASSFAQAIRADAAYLESAAYQRDIAYWTARFDPLPPQLISGLEARPSGLAKVPSAAWTLDGQAFERFEARAKAAGTTAQRALFALFALALGRRHGQSDIVSGIALHRRDASNRFTIGMLAGVIPMRCRFEPWWTLAECAQAFSEQMDADLRHQRLPVDALSRELGLAAAGRAGLFEAAMSYMPADRSPGAQIEGLPVTMGAASTKEASPVSLHASDPASGGAGLCAHIAVNPDFLDPAEAAALLELLQTAAERFAAEPEARFEDLPSTTRRERQLEADEWNRTGAAFPRGTLDALFEEQARRSPDAVAVIARDGRELSYAEVDRKSAELARRLAAAGVRPERVVGVRMERSADTVIALLGILKAGGVYLPLDPAYPAERLDYMAKDAGAILVLETIEGIHAGAIDSSRAIQPAGALIPGDAFDDDAVVNKLGAIDPGHALHSSDRIDADAASSEPGAIHPAGALIPGNAFDDAAVVNKPGAIHPEHAHNPGDGFDAIAVVNKLGSIHPGHALNPSDRIDADSASSEPGAIHPAGAVIPGDAFDDAAVVNKLGAIHPGHALHSSDRIDADAASIESGAIHPAGALIPGNAFDDAAVVNKPGAIHPEHAHNPSDWIDADAASGKAGAIHPADALNPGYAFDASAVVNKRGSIHPEHALNPSDRIDADAASSKPGGIHPAAGALIPGNGFHAAASLPATGADEAPAPPPDPNRLAYIIYTSGTTGLPKGVAVPHAAAVNLAFARRACHDPLGPGDRVLAAVSVGFDVSIGQLLLPLLSGAAVVIAGEVKQMGAPEFWALLAARRVTHINSVPSFLDSILDDLPPGGAPCLRRLMLGGETLAGALAGRVFKALPGVTLVNMYGPTEACIDATYHVATAADLASPALPIGAPLSNYRAYVLDERLEPAGLGVAGELYLGGPGLARCYVNSPDLTAARFIADPFSNTPGGRLYRTGDRARRRPADGMIEFLGRADQQLKIRGFRVEPGEIAAALLEHPSVAQAAAVAVAGASPGAQPRLVAYFVPRPGFDRDIAALRAHLARSLPDYMVPSSFVALAAMPLSPNGKLDVKALPAPEASEAGYVAPRTPAEEVVSELYAEVLGLRRCGALDNFFELGGHSLLAASLVSKIRRLGVTLPLRAVFEAPVAADLARRLDALLAGPEPLEEPLRAETRPDEIPLSFPQQRLWFMDRLRRDASYNIPVAFELAGSLDAEAARRAMERIAARHEALRTRIALRGGRAAQEIAEPAALALERVELAREEDLGPALRSLAGHRFDLASDAPFVLRLFALAPDRHVLAAVIHHAAFDGWSAGILLREFAALYGAFSRGSADPLPPPALQYADFALWQRRQNREAELAYWLEELKGAPAEIELPSSVSLPGAPAAGLPGAREVSLPALPAGAAPPDEEGTGVPGATGIGSPGAADRGAAGAGVSAAALAPGASTLSALSPGASLSSAAPDASSLPAAPGAPLSSAAPVRSSLSAAQDALSLSAAPLSSAAPVGSSLSAAQDALSLSAAPLSSAAPVGSSLSAAQDALSLSAAPLSSAAPVRSSLSAAQDALSLSAAQDTLSLSAAPGGPLLPAAPVALSLSAAPVASSLSAAAVGSSLSSAAPDAPLSSAPPGEPLLPAAPVALSLSAAPVASSLSAAPGASSLSASPVASSLPAAPGTPSWPAAPVASSLPAAPGAPLSSAAPGTPSWPAALGASSLSAAPVASSLPAAPGAPLSSAAPGAQSWPAVRDASTLSAAPNAPSLPAAPAAPPLPAAPDAPPSGAISFDIAPDVHAALARIAQDSGASLFMALHAAFALLLAKAGGQDDVVIGAAVANRPRAEFEQVIGCFVNTLPLRTKFVEGESFAALLERVKASDLAAFAHQDLPFEQLVEALHPGRSPQRTPIFQVMLVLQNAPAPRVHLPGLALRPIEVEAEAAKFDLTLSLEEKPGAGLAAKFEFARERFAFGDIDRLRGQFLRLLAAIAADASADASKIDLLDPAERRLVVDEWNRTEAEFPRGTLDGLFGRQARATPDAIAVVDVDGRELTYAEADAASTGIARRLAARGVAEGSVVGVRMERGAATILAMLGILKAGGAYLPLDPGYPEERLRFMVEDAGAALVLESLAQLGPEEADCAAGSDASRLAYIIYTSGTTGKPKGVAMAHAAAVNLAHARRACHDPLGPGDRVLAAISVGFDVSIGQLLLPLLCGATVVVSAGLQTMGAEEFWALLARRGVTHVNSVPSFLDSILDAAPPAGDGGGGLRRLMLGGEALSGALVARIRRALPGVEVVNMYGPTEACIDATFHVATEGDLGAAVLPIGRPLSNYRAYVLDSRRRPCAPGVAGELYLGGAGLARGYVNSPELTAERFVDDPFRADSKLYRTGDRARWLAGGSLEFLGRADQQLKIRGFRVEPGEIQSRLRGLPGVREAAVALTADGRLAAYFTGDANPQALRDGVAAALPDYMVPSAFVRLDRLPLTANGKLDRKGLPEPGAEAHAARAYEAPEGEAERKMAAAWTEVLRLDRVGRRDNFFELGGHSLLAVALVERMRQQGLAVDVRGLFEAPTIAGLAAGLECAAAESEAAVPENGIREGCAAITPAMVPLTALTQAQIDRIAEATPGGAANIQDIYPLSPLQEGILFQHLMTGGSGQADPYLTPLLLGFDSRERVDLFLAALQGAADRHDALRSAMAWKGLDEPVQAVLRKVRIPVEEAAALPDPAGCRLDLGQAPLLRAIVAREEGRWKVLLLTHHLILDHASMEILVAELRAGMLGPAAALPQAAPYRNFIAETRRPGARAGHEEFFQRMLAGVDEPTAPFGLADVQASGGARVSEARLTIEGGLERRIRERARALGVSPASVFHLAWAAVLAHVSGEKSSVVFGTVLLGRMRGGADAGLVVGMFINTLPVRIDIDATGVAESARRTHALLLELLRHEHAPLALAQKASAASPLFSSLFNFRHSGAAAPDAWPGVEMLAASERTNYPLAMAVDDLGSSFLLTALARQPGADAELACEYLRAAAANLADLLERDPQAPVRDLDVLPAAQRDLVVNQWNRTAADFPRGTLDALFEEQARRTPEAVAVIGGAGELTYAELDRRSTLLARRLAAKGVAEGAAVGVRMERSADTIVALLAILKAGGAYLPLDPAYPADRLDFMAKDAGAALSLRSAGELDGQPEADLAASADPDRLAYIIYTSGTTGAPKGVAVPHSAAVNLAFARRAHHDPLGVGDRVLAAISVGFDVSIGQLLLPLLSGAAVVVAPDLKTLGAAEFWALLALRGVTHVNSVPSFLDSILDAAPAEGLRLKRLMLGGEALSGALAARVRAKLPGVELVNMYGPTEACIDATYHVATVADEAAAALPIGRPLSNYRAYVLDGRMRPAGVGVSGELYLGGAGLARGYVNAAALTDERFVACPFSKGARLYRTGDLARWRADGRIEFLGRVDCQVKIRGFRVEPGEVAAALLEHPGVAQAVVVPRSRNGRTVLAAYVLRGAPEAASLRAHLASRLPDYMIPAAFAVIDAIPVGANGKLDERALPPLDEAPETGAAFTAPRDAAELALQGVFQRVLGVERASVVDSFFDLGGDSLAAMRLANAIHGEFGVEVPMRTLFERPTIEALAAAVRGGGGGAGAPGKRGRLVALQAGGGEGRGALFCVHPAGGHVFCYLPLARALGPDQPVFGLEASGLEEGEPLAESIERMAAEYVAAMREAQPVGPYHLAGLSSGGLIAFEMARQIRAGGGEVALLAMFDTTVPGSGAETIFTEDVLLRAMAGELGCADLSDGVATLAGLVEKAREAGRLPAGFGLERAERIAGVFRNTVRMHLDYRPREWAGPMLVLRALRRFREGDPAPDWSPHASGVEAVDFDCGHADFVSPAMAPAVAALLRGRLERGC